MEDDQSMPAGRARLIGKVLRVAGGNFLEQYDFFVYGFYATYIAKAFFPANSEAASIMLSLATFGIGFLMRPIGAVVLGAYIDRVGRRQGLLVTLGAMAIGTLTITFTPSYASIGILAPAIVVAGRLLQGFSAGAELGGVSVYLSEIARPGQRGFYVAWQSASQQVAVLFAAAFGFVLANQLGEARMEEWGWRIPMGVGCAIIPLILWLRGSLEETEAFMKQDHKPHSLGEVSKLLVGHWQPILLGAMLVTFTTTAFYMITAYTPTFGKAELKLAPDQVLLVTAAVGVSNLFWLPVGGALSDRIGRFPMLLAMPVMTILCAYPIMAWLVHAPSLGRLLATVLVYSAFYGLYNGSMVPLLTEFVPPNIRTAAFSLAYSLATALFGGFTPLVSTALIAHTGNKAAPALWLCLAGAISIVGALLVRARTKPSYSEWGD
ncbi:MAG: MFS transporter [Sphingomonadales bacterium]|nr:MFS transporter [Sphingomonadales bacterium]